MDFPHQMASRGAQEPSGCAGLKVPLPLAEKLATARSETDLRADLPEGINGEEEIVRIESSESLARSIESRKSEATSEVPLGDRY